MLNAMQRLLETCYSCGPEHTKCGHCRLGCKDGIYKSDLVEALLYGFEPFKGGGKKGRTTLSKAQQSKVLEDVKQGKSITAIANELIVSRGVIYRLLKKVTQYPEL